MKWWQRVKSIYGAMRHWAITFSARIDDEEYDLGTEEMTQQDQKHSLSQEHVRFAKGRANSEN